MIKNETTTVDRKVKKNEDFIASIHNNGFPIFDS